MRKGGKQNRKKQIWRVSLFRWRASWVSVCAGVGAFAAQHIVCRSVRVWVCISMDARKGQKEKNYNIFLELYPGRQLPLHFFHSFFFSFGRFSLLSFLVYQPEYDHPRFAVMEKFPGCICTERTSGTRSEGGKKREAKFISRRRRCRRARCYCCCYC